MQKGNLINVGAITKVYGDDKWQKFHMLNVKKIFSFADDIVFW